MPLASSPSGRGEVVKNTDKARELRKNQTDAEQLLWQQLRNRQFLNLKFRRQLPLGNYFVDFACQSLKVIIELDGSQHMDNVSYDEKRTLHLKSLGYLVIRFWNNQVLNEMPVVLEALTLTLSQRERGLCEEN